MMIRMRFIDGTRLKEFLTCPRLSYLSFHQPKDVELPPTPRMKILFKSGYRVEERILKELGSEDVSFEGSDWEDGLRATVELMDRKVPAISNGVLKFGMCLGRPDLLLWNEEEDCYEVADIKSSQKVHASAMIQVSFYSKMLGQIRKAPRLGHVIVRDGSRFTFEVPDLAASVDHLVERMEDFRTGEDSDPGPHLIPACEDCRYHDLCRNEMEGRDDIGLVPGLTRAQAEALRAVEVKTVESLGALKEPRRIARNSELQVDLLRRLTRSAQAVQLGDAIRLGDCGRELKGARISLAVLQNARYSKAPLAVAGMEVGGDGRFRIRYLRERESADSGKEFRELILNLARSEGHIMVFGPAFLDVLEHFVDLEPMSASAVGRLRKRTVDLRAELRRAVVLPSIARTPTEVMRILGLAVCDEDTDLAALRYLEEEDGSTRDALEDLLRRDLMAMDQLRRFLLREEVFK